MIVGLTLAAALAAAAPVPTELAARPAPDSNYSFITPAVAPKRIMIDGHNLTISELVSIARKGAVVDLSNDARRRSADALGLLLQGAAEGVSIYWFNRGTGDQRETTLFTGDPTSPANSAFIKQRQADLFAERSVAYGPEIDRQDLVRAIMAIRANTMSFEAASPALTQMLIDFLNHGVTPVLNSRGTVGEGDLAIMHEIGMVMVGKGEAYFRGERLSGEEALRRAGLTPLVPTGADDSALISTNAVAVARAALLVSDAENILDWADISTAIAMLGMNSSVTPLSYPVQSSRPFPWLNWDAARVLMMLKGSYLMEADPKRIIQDPESLRASTQRIGSAWQAWGQLRDAVALSMNSSDHNPAVRVGLKPTDSWELSTPEMMRFYVKGGPLSHGQSGYILSNANWDPYPLANLIESFTTALGNCGVVFGQRIDRFRNPFFTLVRPSEILSPAQLARHITVGDYLPSDLTAELNTQLNPILPQGQAIASSVEDLQAGTRQKLDHAEKAIELTGRLIALDLLTATSWLDIRRAQDGSRTFGATAEAVRRDWRGGDADALPITSGEQAFAFMQSHPARTYLTTVQTIPRP